MVNKMVNILPYLPLAQFKKKSLLCLFPLLTRQKFSLHFKERFLGSGEYRLEIHIHKG